MEAETRATKRKAEEEAERQVEMNADETGAKGTKRNLGESLGDWVDYARMLKRRSEQKVTEKEQAAAGMDVGQLEILSFSEKMD